MKQAHSTKWKASVQPRKQRKYAHEAPYHIQGAFLRAHLSKELKKKHGVRSLRVRTGDKVRIMRGTHKGKEGKVESVDLGNARLHVAKIENAKLQGGTARYPVRPSNCLLVELASDRKRFKQTLPSPAGKTAPPVKKEAAMVATKEPDAATKTQTSAARSEPHSESAKKS